MKLNTTILWKISLHDKKNVVYKPINEKAKQLADKYLKNNIILN